MLTIDFSSIKKASGTLKNIQKQVSYATAQAANDTAKDVQKHTIEVLLPDRFTLRSKGAPWHKPGNRFGFNIKFASKSLLEAKIGSQADWLLKQEKGGVKIVSGHRLAIPTDFWKKREEIMSANKKPRAILEGKLQEDANRAQTTITTLKSRIEGNQLRSRRDRLSQTSDKQKLRRAKRDLRVAKASQAAVASTANKPFEAKLKNGREGIFVRTNSGKGSMRALFWYVKQATINPILDFEKTGAVIVNTNFERHFEKRLLTAIATAK